MKGGVSMRLENKIAIITGGARGLGKAIALRFTREGARLTICDLLDCSPVAREIEDLGGEVLALQTDITSEEAVTAMARQTADKFGRIDIIINNAAAVGGIEIPDFMKPAEQLTASDWNRILEVNVKGTFLCSKAVIPYMKEQRKGIIINISSTTALGGKDRRIYQGTDMGGATLDYHAAKGAVQAMTRDMAVYLAQDGIRVNSICPGGFWRNQPEKFVKAYCQLVPMGRMGLDGKEMKGAAVFLASEASSYVTGQTLVIDGGCTSTLGWER